MKFVEESYLKNDQKAKNLLTKFLQHRGHQVFDNDDKYGIDLYSTIPNKKFWWEVEMKSKRPWTCRDDFKFDTVSFLARKKKWEKELFWYVIICEETTAALICRADTIFQEKYKEKLYINTAQRKGSDIFYRVPKEYCIFVPPEEFNV